MLIKRFRNTLLISTILIILTACSTTMQPQPTKSEVIPVTETSIPTAVPTKAETSDTQSEVIVDSIEVMILESFPVQVKATVTGSLTNGCVQIKNITADREENEFRLTIETEKSGEMCTEALVPFSQTIDLDVYGLKAGKYTVTAQDKSTKFELAVDNILALDENPEVKPEDGEDNGEEDGGEEMMIGEKVYVEQISIIVSESTPPEVQIQIQGNLPDGCTKIHEITSELTGENTITLHIYTERPAGAMCTMALKPFNTMYTIDTSELSTGTYQVIVKEQTTTFTIK